MCEVASFPRTGNRPLAAWKTHRKLLASADTCWHVGIRLCLGKKLVPLNASEFPLPRPLHSLHTSPGVCCKPRWHLCSHATIWYRSIIPIFQRGMKARGMLSDLPQVMQRGGGRTGKGPQSSRVPVQCPGRSFPPSSKYHTLYFLFRAPLILLSGLAQSNPQAEPAYLHQYFTCQLLAVSG